MAEQPTTIPTLAEQFIEHLGNSGKSSLTIVAYRNDLAQLASFLAGLGKTAPTTVTSADIEMFKQDLGNKNYTAKSVARKLNAVKGLFRWAAKTGLAKDDPAASVPHPKYELAAPRILSPLEYRALRDAAREDARIAAIVELLLQTGMRISEVASLKFEDIKNLNGTKNLGGTKNLKDQKETGVIIGKREVSLNDAAKRALERYLELRPKVNSSHLFVTKTGRQLLVRNIRATIERCFAEAGIENATVNDLRNTFIVYQLSRGVDLLRVSQIVGHKRLATTERYLELVKDSKTIKRSGLSEL